MRIRFTKMQGLGNDFVVFDGIRQSLSLSPEVVRRLCNRRFGVGCDQVLLVEPPSSAQADFRYRIFNADGGEVEQCGNGARCFARFVHEQGLSDKTTLAVETLGGLIRPRLEADGRVSVDMGVPEFEPARIPFRASSRQELYTLDVGGETLSLSVVSVGNPHAVLQVEDVETAPVAVLGPRIEAHEAFPRRVNAGFMQVLDRGHIRLRVYERGVGETLACGTGACAAVVAGRQRGQLDAKVRVSLPGGDLEIHWEGEGRPVQLCGPAETVFEGSIDLEQL